MQSTDVLKELIKLSKVGDKELAHVEADDLLCKFITELGYPEITIAFKEINKWYA